MLDATHDREIQKAFVAAAGLRGRGRLPVGSSLALWRGDDSTDVAAFVEGEQRWALRVSHLVPVRQYGQARELPTAEIAERLKRAAISLAFALIDEHPASKRAFAS